MTCKKCGGKGYIEYYHDAGDHFGAGTAPNSEWRQEPCPECSMKDDDLSGPEEIARMHKKVLAEKLKDRHPAPVGWICPLCGRANAPFTGTCPCIPMKYEVTCS